MITFPIGSSARGVSSLLSNSRRNEGYEGLQQQPGSPRRLEKTARQIDWVVQLIEEEANQRRALELRVRRLEAREGRDLGAGPPIARGGSLDGAPLTLSSEEDMQEEEDDGCFSRLTSRAMSDFLEDFYAFEESTWDASLFTFIRGVGHCPSLSITVLFIINIVTQVFFLMVVGYYLCQDALTDHKLESLLRFRADIAHHVLYADTTSGKSLANQVCSNDVKIPWAGTQSDFLDDISVAKEGGLFLCTLVVLCWLVTLTGELDSSMRFATAVVSLAAKGKPTHLVPEGDGARLESISIGRCIFVVFFAVIPRLGVAVSLVVVGVKFLVVTVSMGDLLLNALALAFVVDVDNLLYAAFAPNRLKSIMARVAPVTYPAGYRCFLSLALGTFMKVALVSGTLLWVFCYRIQPFYERMNLAYDMLCSGNTDFVVGLNTATGLIEATSSYSARVTEWSGHELSVLSLAQPAIRSSAGFLLAGSVLEAIRGERDVVMRMDLKSTEKQMLHPNRSVEVDEIKPSLNVLRELNSLQQSPVAEMVKELACADRPLSKNLNFGTRSCTEAKHMCGWPNMTALRAHCPVTCGCPRLEAPPASFFAGAEFGCPPKCRYAMSLENTQQLPCLDALPSEFSQHAGLRKYFATALSFFASRSKDMVALKTAIEVEGPRVGIPKDLALDAMMSIANGTYLERIWGGHWDLVPGAPHPRGLQGCQFWTSWEVHWIFGMNFCSHERWRSLRLHCPVSCECYFGREQCPGSCRGAPHLHGRTALGWI